MNFWWIALALTKRSFGRTFHWQPVRLLQRCRQLLHALFCRLLRVGIPSA